MFTGSIKAYRQRGFLSDSATSQTMDHKIQVIMVPFIPADWIWKQNKTPQSHWLID